MSPTSLSRALTVSLEEFTAALATLGVTASGETEDEIKVMFDELDANQDGYIDYEELRAFLKPHLEGGGGSGHHAASKYTPVLPRVVDRLK